MEPLDALPLAALLQEIRMANQLAADLPATMPDELREAHLRAMDAIVTERRAELQRRRALFEQLDDQRRRYG